MGYFAYHGAAKTGKVKLATTHLPEGLLVDAGWLQRQGYSSGLRSKYVAHGWLDQVARSVYRRPAAPLPAPNEDEGLRWQHVVISLQTLLDCPVVVGGRTALELQGFAHYLTAAGPREIHLYGGKAPPGWVSKLKLGQPARLSQGREALQGRSRPSRPDVANR